MTSIVLTNAEGRELDRVDLADEDATTEAIARAAIDILQARMSMNVGCTIRVHQEED